MAYEIVLRTRDGRQSSRVGERPQAVGDRIKVDSREWVVVAVEPPRVRGTLGRIVCESGERR
jgi:hypothetical protein